MEDSDISYCSKTFGFETAFSKAVEAVQSAHVEAYGTHYGVVVIKLMGRDSGFIAANTSLACPDVNFVLIPEVRFDLNGPEGMMAAMENSFADASAPGTRHTQYFETGGHRALYHDGWVVASFHGAS